ncbi:rod-binding protein [Simkania negevensis]|uniref:Rod-binding protein n=1 Tax=Simkania negevensis TaxID=83561 RepID=A0ABS3APQ5_9BACT|nr:rod-binding protein [Simkania negevensis]
MDISFAMPAAQQPIKSYYVGGTLDAKEAADPKKVGALFEAILYRILFKEARNSSLDDGLFDSMASKQYKEMMDDEMANVMGQKGYLGIASILEKEEASLGKDNGTQHAVPLLGLLKE